MNANKESLYNRILNLKNNIEYYLECIDDGITYGIKTEGIGTGKSVSYGIECSKDLSIQKKYTGKQIKKFNLFLINYVIGGNIYENTGNGVLVNDIIIREVK